MDLSKFLLARIAEDEAAAKGGLGKASYYAENAAEETLSMAYNEGCASTGPEHFARWKPARVLAECDAKRRIVERHSRWTRPGWGLIAPNLCRECGGEAEVVGWPCLTLRLLAAPYSDYPDYQPEWSPTALAG